MSVTARCEDAAAGRSILIVEEEEGELESHYLSGMRAAFTVD